MPIFLLFQLEEEASKLYDLIMEEDQITLNAVADSIVPIQRWIEKWSLVLWRQAFREFFSRNSTFSKKVEFLSTSEHREGNEEVGDEVFLLRASS